MTNVDPKLLDNLIAENERYKDQIEWYRTRAENDTKEIERLRELLREHLARISPLDAASGTLYRKTNAALKEKP